MLGVEGYGSDSDSDTEKSSISLPPPSKSTNAVPSGSKPAGGLSLPPPKAKRPKKIAIGLPDLPPEGDKNDDDGPPAKKARIEPGARTSGLLSMLPAPKNKAPVLAAPERVVQVGLVEDVPDDDQYDQDESTDAPEAPEASKAPSSLPFLPPSLVKGKANVSVEEKAERPRAVRSVISAPAVDFFSLGSSSISSAPSAVKAPPSMPASSPPKLPLIPGVSSAPKIEDFVPPEPTPQDSYPGYYMLPTGAWAAYDPDYYRKFYDKWKKDYDNHVRGQRDLGDGEGEEEIQDREEKKALTTGGADVPVAPKMNIKGAALGGRARTRHQLSTLLTEAYQNREALEEQIAQGRRNRKEAGNKLLRRLFNSLY
ncbi:mitotic checkpoint regulator, MAD2B-interacting-domain-containing protein [Fomitopsis serialis]|uniref:mitotic checkpoint regulator, MAD2B-interacting-domain-containing protein n=1 Tax=Fomitopsis serialis TaxID=139415 RepID=UPI00200899BD|nr:mitotic checkpoint regulator, MAD2B-interacting-domain-containing protein [Neoantrodia serialis]KAH9934995.1 mitotic checkpoint regulator, MAD2B-interacting-domain-containing protein [Neoantrodia serialis]